MEDNPYQKPFLREIIWDRGIFLYFDSTVVLE